MNKFTNQINESNKPLPKFLDKTKQEIYSLINENVKRTDELTDELYSYIQNEKLKGEINILESVKTILVAGPFNYIVLNDRIDELKKQIK